MVAVRLLPLAAAVVLGALHTGVSARPLHHEGLSLRSFATEAYDDATLALREPFDEDSFEENFEREPIVLTEAELAANLAIGRTPPRVPGTPATNKPLPAKPPKVPGTPATNKPLPPKPVKKRSFDEDDILELVQRMILTEAELQANLAIGRPKTPPPAVPGTPATNKPLPATPPPPQVPGKPANNKPLPAKPVKKRSFDEDDFERRDIEELIEELVRREYFDDMYLD